MSLYPPCERCGLSDNVETYCMMGVGPIDARVFLCGEAPGADEDRQGEPFVGRAGELLRDEWSKVLGFPLTDVFVTNCVKCRSRGSGPEADLG